MFLKRIKLAGFKSFVDPLSIDLHEKITSVVGPNGCGKSNVIDAVRWVMGESSAKKLRGESLDDVIFNGAASRKPVGQAMVELIFDNSDGTAGGEYASFSEISVKRISSRDGSSNYFLNGARCRRRDITDVFLGTGLGPRSYSIIEQGMISRFIEAKPEELRNFVEEASGVSKYKERRRETENRIRHTHENLARLQDLIIEQEKLLSRLERQAQAAQKYNVFKQEQQQLESKLHSLKWQHFNSQHSDLQQKISSKKTEIEALAKQQSHLTAIIEDKRATRIDLTDNRDKIQQVFYSTGTEIARVEEHISNNEQQQQQLTSQQQQARSHAEHLLRQQQQQQQQLQQLVINKQQLEPQTVAAKQQLEQATATLRQQEEALQQLQQQWDEFQKTSNDAKTTADVEKNRIDELEDRTHHGQKRIEKLQQELENIAIERLQQELATVNANLEQQQQQLTTLQQKLTATDNSIYQLRDAAKAKQNDLNQSKAEQQQLLGKIASLEALQQAALGKKSTTVNQWLQAHGLDNNQRLGQVLQVEAGWELAAETVLSETLEAIAVDDLNTAANNLHNFGKGKLQLICNENFAATNVTAALPTLSVKVKSSININNLLGNILCANSITEALEFRHNLTPEQSIITKDGLWVGYNWVKVAKEVDERQGVLAREQELKQNKQQSEELAALVATTEDESNNLQQQLTTLEQQRSARQREINEQQQTVSRTRSQQASLETRVQQLQKRQQQITEEQQEIESSFENWRQQLLTARGKRDEALAQMAQNVTQEENLRNHREQARSELSSSRQQERELRQSAHQLELNYQKAGSEINALEQAVANTERQISSNSNRQQQLEQQLTALIQPLAELKEKLQQMLQQKVAQEQQLTQAQQQLTAIENGLKQQESERDEIANTITEAREIIQNWQLEQQELKVRLESVSEKLTDLNVNPQEVIAALTEEYSIEQLQHEVDITIKKIERLGAINLAAIEEYQEELKRKEYLEGQIADVSEALATLENTIKKIDDETRTRFRETFDKINSRYKEIFPRLFGGGNAYLELTEEDLLQAGVSVMAQPPGKRNSNIHLLSGGEKALTAVALVFAIFYLNPAPFCMLDEVDAPLDDANVGRFCSLVAEMSENVQFIFITHNKIAMETAQNLIGVTMREPGVSRLVAVNIEEAAQLAEAS